VGHCKRTGANQTQNLARSGQRSRRAEARRANNVKAASSASSITSLRDTIAKFNGSVATQRTAGRRYLDDPAFAGLIGDSSDRARGDASLETNETSASRLSDAETSILEGQFRPISSTPQTRQPTRTQFRNRVIGPEDGEWSWLDDGVAFAGMSRADGTQRPPRRRPQRSSSSGSDSLVHATIAPKPPPPPRLPKGPPPPKDPPPRVRPMTEEDYIKLNEREKRLEKKKVDTRETHKSNQRKSNQPPPKLYLQASTLRKMGLEGVADLEKGAIDPMYIPDESYDQAVRRDASIRATSTASAQRTGFYEPNVNPHKRWINGTDGSVYKKAQQTLGIAAAEGDPDEAIGAVDEDMDALFGERSAVPSPGIYSLQRAMSATRSDLAPSSPRRPDSYVPPQPPRQRSQEVQDMDQRGHPLRALSRPALAQLQQQIQQSGQVHHSIEHRIEVFDEGIRLDVPDHLRHQRRSPRFHTPPPGHAPHSENSDDFVIFAPETISAGQTNIKSEPVDDNDGLPGRTSFQDIEDFTDTGVRQNTQAMGPPPPRPERWRPRSPPATSPVSRGVGPTPTWQTSGTLAFAGRDKRRSRAGGSGLGVARPSPSPAPSSSPSSLLPALRATAQSPAWRESSWMTEASVDPVKARLQAAGMIR